MRRALVLGLALTGTPALAQGPAPGDGKEAWAAAVRTATARYRDRAAAIADGYRRVGPDFPSMGEHWVSIPLIVQGEFDPLRPPILEYVTIGGRPTLAGVAYTRLTRGEPFSAPIPAPSSAWHNHAGSVDEESFILGHAERGGALEPGDRPSIAVLHAWLWLENPAGLYATDNWALPWYRLGIAPPTGSDEPTPAAMMAALAAGGREYFLTLLRLRDGLQGEAAALVGVLLDRHAARWAGRLQAAAAEGPLPLAELSAAWTALDGELRLICRDCSLSPHAHHP